MPEEALAARVALIYKRGDTHLCGNYRPISLLNTMCSILRNGSAPTRPFFSKSKSAADLSKIQPISMRMGRGGSSRAAGGGVLVSAEIF